MQGMQKNTEKLLGGFFFLDSDYRVDEGHPIGFHMIFLGFGILELSRQGRDAEDHFTRHHCK